VSTKPEFESQDLRNIIRYILKVSGDMAECGLVHFWWGAGNERLSLDSTREDRITTVKNGTERSMKKLTAKMPKAQHLPLGHRIVQMKLVSNLMPPTQPAQALHRRMGNEKATFPFKQYRLPLVNLVDTNQIMTKLQGFKRRGWPKLKRLRSSYSSQFKTSFAPSCAVVGVTIRAQKSDIISKQINEDDHVQAKAHRTRVNPRPLIST
jgi:hypothetical protein